MPSPKHFLQFKDLGRDELEYLFGRTRWIKQQFKAYQPHHPMFDRTLVMIFEKQSTRTRLSFEAGMHQLGGSAIFLSTRDRSLAAATGGSAAQVISRMCDIVMIPLSTGDHRTFRGAFARAGHQRVDQRIPPLPDPRGYLHLHRATGGDPSRRWRGSETRTMYAHLAAGAEVLGFNVHVSTPPGYEVEPERAGLYGTDLTRSSRTYGGGAPRRPWSPPTCGPAWVSRRRTKNANAISRIGRWMRNDAACNPEVLFMHCLPPIVERKSPPR